MSEVRSGCAVRAATQDAAAAAAAETVTVEHHERVVATLAEVSRDNATRARTLAAYATNLLTGAVLEGFEVANLTELARQSGAVITPAMHARSAAVAEHRKAQAARIIELAAEVDRLRQKRRWRFWS